MMVGRAAYQTPWMLSEVDARIFGDPAGAVADRHAVAEAMAAYADRMRIERGTPLKAVGRHMLGLFQGLPGARGWRRRLAGTMYAGDATGDALREAAALVPAGSTRRAA